MRLSSFFFRHGSDRSSLVMTTFDGSTGFGFCVPSAFATVTPSIMILQSLRSTAATFASIFLRSWAPRTILTVSPFLIGDGAHVEL